MNDSQTVCDYCNERIASVSCDVCGAQICSDHKLDYGCKVCGGGEQTF